MTTLQEMIDIEEIKILKSRYFRYMDTKNWRGWKDIFTADATMETPEVTQQPVTKGVDKIIEFCSTILEGAATIHHGHMPEITIISSNNASGIWALHDVLFWKTPNKHGWSSLHGAGHYHETYERTALGWRIKTLSLTRIWLERI